MGNCILFGNGTRNKRCREYMQKYWDVATYSTESSFTHDDYDGFQIPADDDMKKDTTKEYSFLKRRALSIEKEEKSVSSLPPFTIELLDTSPISRNDAHHKDLVDLPVVTKRKNDKKQYNRKFKYDPALMLMGLGKRKQDSSHQHNKTLKQKRSVHESDPMNSNSDKEQRRDQAAKNIRNNNYSSEWRPIIKRSTKDQPLMTMMDVRKSVVAYDKQNLSDYGMQSMLDSGSMRIKDYLNPDALLAEEDLSKRLFDNKPERLDSEDERTDSSYNAILDYDSRKVSGANSKRSSSYDPALKYMGLGKKNSYYDPALKYMGLGKKSSSYDPALRYMGLGKKDSYYDPALKYMGLGKKSSSYDPALKYMGLGKRSPSFDPALKYMGLGKKSPSFDPALKYMGLGKRGPSFDPALKYMGLGKRISSYDPALKYMGLGKKSSGYDPALKYMGLGKKSSNYDPALQYMGLGKKSSSYDPALKYMGLGKKSKNYDPALKYMGLGKKRSNYDQDKRGGNNQNSGKVSYDPALIYMGLGKRQTWSESFDHFSFHPSFNHGDAYKQAYDNVRKMNFLPPTPKISNSKTSGYIFSAAENATNSNNFDSPSKSTDANNRVIDYKNEVISNDKRPYGYDPASRFMGTSKGKDLESRPVKRTYYDYPDPKLVQKLVNYFDSLRPQSGRYLTPTANDETSESFDNSDHQNVGHNNNYDFLRNSQKKSAMYDPALRYMGLGKRNATDKPEFEIALSDHFGPDCENTCKYSTRKKRDVNGNEDRLPRITSPHFSLKIQPQDQFTSDSGLDDLVISSSNGGLMTLHENKRKRERDNRPKYNPGWIFIGLGKRSPDATVESHRIIQMDQPNTLLLKYYNLMEKIKDKLQKVKYDLIDKGYRNNEKWIAFHNFFTGASDLKEYPELYPLIEHELNNSPDLIADSGLHTPPLNVRPKWKVNIVPAYENPSNPGK
ncbi:hypothetical protein AVEN_229924-1 [Araneus ventricosus]|uniref:Uncharacterized protein n=1 Tax=Araneus ventricosus TaxID=182803 RepID=A0A4Y2BWA5_ARAVE|nr:hypothetical protein AVEN_229924-1 [Araneus ventricosus]